MAHRWGRTGGTPARNASTSDWRSRQAMSLVSPPSSSFHWFRGRRELRPTYCPPATCKRESGDKPGTDSSTPGLTATAQLYSSEVQHRGIQSDPRRTSAPQLTLHTTPHQALLPRVRHEDASVPHLRQVACPQTRCHLAAMTGPCTTMPVSGC